MDLSSRLKNKPTEILTKQLSDLFMQAPVGFCVAKGNDHVIELANKEFLRLTGRDNNIIGKPITEVFPEIDAQGYLSLLNKILINKETIFLKENPAVILKNGVKEIVYINIVFQPYLDGDDAVGILSILTDVTDHVLARKKIEESEERLRLATETTKLGTWEFLPQTGELTWSDECKRIYKFPLDKEVDFDLFSDHIYPEDKDFALTEINKAMDPAGSGRYDIEYRILKYTDKSVRWIRAQGKVFFNEEKKPARFIGTVLDITDAKSKEETVRINEERLRLAVESGRLGTYELDIPNSSIIFSPRLAELFGLNPAEKRTHKDLRNALHPEDVHIRDEAHEKAKETGSLFYEARVIWPDKSIHWIRLNGNVVYDKAGNALRTYGTALDITEEKETERILKESEEKYRLIADAVPHMVWEVELDGTISYINKQWADYSGLSLEELNHGGWSKVLHPEDAEMVGKGWMDAFANKKTYVGECRIKNPDGGYSWFTLKTVPIKNDKDDVELWIGTATDIHDKKIAEQQKDEFISIASHELKTPVTSIKGFTQILLMKFEKEGNNEAADLLSRMDNQVNKLTKLIIDLLDATKIENGQLKFAKENFDFNELVMEVSEEMQRTTESHEIKANLTDTKMVSGDRNRIGQVIINLVSNAIKYSPNAKEVIITSTVEKNNIKLCVKDFGIGIPEEKIANVFDRFFRVGGDKQYTFPGLGLGLFISSEIIKRHNGKITVQSTLKKGSTFCFTLPLSRSRSSSRRAYAKL
jgi:PAS domain S-box-containing protein